MQLRDIPDVKWVYVGDGSRKAWLDKFIVDNGLQDCAITLGRFPFAAMPAFYAKADAMLVTLRSEFPHLGMVVPARLQSYMSAGRPVLAMIGPGGQDIIRESDCGYAVDAGDVDAFVKVIREKVLTDRKGFEAKGQNGRRYYEENFRKEDCIYHLEEIIKAK